MNSFARLVIADPLAVIGLGCDVAVDCLGPFRDGPGKGSVDAF